MFVILKHIDEVYIYIINAFFRIIQIKNDIDYIIIIFRKTQLNKLKKYKQNEYFFIKTYYADLIIIE